MESASRIKYDQQASDSAVMEINAEKIYLAWSSFFLNLFL
jgi:hypothetical protein